MPIRIGVVPCSVKVGNDTVIVTDDMSSSFFLGDTSYKVQVQYQ
jgi:hypothetical protein